MSAMKRIYDSIRDMCEDGLMPKEISDYTGMSLEQVTEAIVMIIDQEIRENKQ